MAAHNQSWELARAVAGALTELSGWRWDLRAERYNEDTETGDYAPHLAEYDGDPSVTIMLTDEWRDKSRVGVRGVYPVHADGKATLAERGYNVTAPSITVSGERTPRAIARDILRRLVPDVRTMTADALAEIAEYDQANATLHQHVARLGLDCNAIQDGATATRFHSYHHAGQEWYGDAEVFSGGTVNLDLRGIPVELAAKVLELIGWVR